jgi:7,8-dihydroneopterin aldolase/epimerase/oxygenase
MIVQVHGLELFGRHGVDDDEREQGQTFLVDVTLHVQEPAEDSLEATFDYRRARDLVRAVNDGTSYKLLETFAAAAADALVAEPEIERVSVTIRKPGIAWADWTAATVERP